MLIPGTEQIITVGDKKYTLSRLTKNIMDEFAHWAFSQLEDPLDIVAAKLDKFPERLQELMVKEAMKLSRQRYDCTSPEVQSVLNSVDGMCKMVCLLLREHHPEVSEEQAFDIAVRFREESGDSFRASEVSEVSR